ncbi:SRPBCC family protein [Vallicoccus soli]|uniref:Cyclase n=1 Tax=Vallicoccus soli TaxID=2339232 RepID=A0A3A3Z2D1_9ACTN|nr:SRPBCC family protein [Vallicoccus soli]RJK96884.1 cyclase [Vallicoccus soli]
MADRTESSTTVGASPAQVMAVIADMEAYPDWNAEVKRVEVLSRHADGRPERVRFVLDAGLIKDTYVLAYAWTEASTSWSLVEASTLTAMDGSYALREVPGGTDVTYRLTVDVKVPMLGIMKRKAEQVVVDRALKGLKQRVEG